MARFALVVCLAVVLAPFAFSQVNPDDPGSGNLPFVTQMGTRFESVDLATSSINFHVPVRSKTGKTPFEFSLVGNYHPWISQGAIQTVVWQWNVNPALNGGAAGLLGSRLSQVTQDHQCSSQHVLRETIFGIVDFAGTLHPAPPNTYVDFSNLCSGPQSTSFTTTDNSGLSASIPSIDTFILYDKSGNSSPQQANNNVIVYDPDNITLQKTFTSWPLDGSYTDTLNTTALSFALGGGITVGGPDVYSYTGGDGGTSKVTVTYSGPYTLATAFGCSLAGYGIAEVNQAGVYLPTQIVENNTGATYQLSYEQTWGHNSSFTTGRLTQILLPMGGSISYTYQDSTGNHGINCNSGVVPKLTRTVKDNNGNTGIWTYVNSNNAAFNSCAPGAQSSACNYTVVVTDPAGDTITHYFSGENETERIVTDVNLGLLSTMVKCYNGNNASKSACVSPSSVPSVPIKEVDTYTYLGGSTTPSLVKDVYDCNTSNPCYGLLTAEYRYAWTYSNPPTYPPGSNWFSATGISYGSNNGSGCVAIGNYISDRPCAVQVTNTTTGLSWKAYTYNPEGHPTALSMWASGGDYGHMSYSYNSNGTLASATETDNSITTNYAYNGTGGCDGLLLTGVTYPLVGSVQLSTSQTWNCSGGVVTSSTDANSNVTNFSYNDPLWRQTEVAYPDGGSTSTTYNTGSSLPWSIATTTAVSSSQNATTTNTLDGLGRTVQSTSSDPNSSTGYHYVNTVYDNLGRVYSITNPFFTTGDQTYGLTGYSYDALSRTLKITHPDGSYASSIYTNRAVEVTDEVGIQRIYQGDGLGNLAYVCDGINANTQANGQNPSACGLDINANGFLTTYGYDALGDLTSVNYSGQMRTYAYDGLSRLTSEINPESGTTTYSYDAQMWGDLYQRTRPLPNQTGTTCPADCLTTTYTHDALHRLTKVSYPGTVTPAANFQYDMSSGWGGNGLKNGLGRLTYAYTGTSSSPTTGTQLSYDVMGRPTWVFECTPLICGTSASTIVYAYNYIGEPTSMLDNDPNRTLSYAYNSIGQLTGLTSTQTPTTILSNILYNPLGAIASETRADAGTTTNAYDNRGRLTSHVAGSDYSLSLGYSSSNNVTSLTDSINGTWTSGYAAHFANRLGNATCSVNCPTGASPFSYAYDQFGNRWGTINGVNQYTFDANNHITNNGIVYDAVGNMTADGLNHTYTYDAESRMIAMNSNYTATYDAFGNRVEETSAGITDDYIFGLNGRILHYNVPGSRGLGEDVYANGEHIGLYAGGTLHMLHHDQVNSVRKWTVYSGGAWSSDQTVTNLPFGDALTPMGNAESDHDYFGDYIQDPDGEFKSETRRYSAVQGRWSTPDPAGLAAVDPTNPQSWNRYTYVLNNPLSHSDPSGLWPGDDSGCDSDHYDCGSSGGSPSDPGATGFDYQIDGFSVSRSVFSRFLGGLGLGNAAALMSEALQSQEGVDPSKPWLTANVCADGECQIAEFPQLMTVYPNISLLGLIGLPPDPANNFPTIGPAPRQPSQPSLKPGCTNAGLWAGAKAAANDFFGPPGSDPLGDVGDALRDKNVQRAAAGTLYVVASNARYLAPALDVAADFIPVVGEALLLYQVGSALYEGGKAYKEAIDQCYGTP